MAESELTRGVAAVRRFNRFYTRQIGLLQEGYLRTPFSLTEARVIYELARQGQTTATELRRELGLDAGYLSRILRDFRKRGLVDKQACEHDGRRQLLSLTQEGSDAFVALDSASRDDIETMLKGLPEDGRRRLLDAMHGIESILGAQPESRIPYILRPHQPGDMGWVVQRHGELYNREYGWDEQFEALVAEIAAGFLRNFDPARERCWIAEREGVNVGSVFLVKESDATAKLRLLLVEPEARGLGIGGRLVHECTRFARGAGYGRIVLWTNSVLHAARHLYEREGYRLVDEKPHHSFGHDLVGQDWVLEL